MAPSLAARRTDNSTGFQPLRPRSGKSGRPRGHASSRRQKLYPLVRSVSGWENAQLSKIDFNSENYGHRLLLAQAMRDYAREPGRTLSGTKEGGEPSLLAALADAGVAMSKSNLDRIAAAGHPDDRERPYGNNARRVAKYLEEKGYFPPGQKPDDVFKLLPLFFGGFSESGAALLQELEGHFDSFLWSEFNDNLVAVGHITIGSLTPWNYAPFLEEIGNEHMQRDMLHCSGVAFCDDQKNLYLIGREYFRQYPRFYMFEGIDRPDGKTIGVIRGTVLGGGLHTRRHLSPIALTRSKYDQNLSGAHINDLPEYVAHYLSLSLAPGSKNVQTDVAFESQTLRKSNLESK